MIQGGIATFIAYEALEAKRRVKIKSGTTSDPPEVHYADAGEDAIGVTEYAVAITERVAIRLITDPGTFEVEVTVSSAISRGTILYGANDGKLSDASSGSAQGVALEAANSSTDHIECLIWSVKSTTAATVSIADSGGHTAQTTVEAALQEIYASLDGAHLLPIPLRNIGQLDGTTLIKQATNVAGFLALTNDLVIGIPINCTAGESLSFELGLPGDIDIASNVTVKVLVSKAADLDALTLDCLVYPFAAGDFANADIQDTAAQAIVEAGTVLTFVCGADGLLAMPSGIRVTLVLGGTNDGDAVYIWGVWIGYTKALVA